jgi:CRP-like cAMP-binding protein
MNPLAIKLRSFCDLPDDELLVLKDMCSDVRTFRPKQDIIKQGERPEAVFLLLEGWAIRYKYLANGHRQIVAFLVPGDLCDPRVFILKEMDHSIGFLTEARVAVIPKPKMIAALDEPSALMRALWWSTLVDEGVLREWLVNIGQRDAYGRIAHLLTELSLRLQVVNRVKGQSFRLPLTQADLGDALGLTSVHVNRTIMRLRNEGLIEWSGGYLHIPDARKLMRASHFDAGYLHLERRVA